MSQTWTQFVANVQARYNPGAQTTAREAAALRAVADYVKSEIVREVDGDIQLRQSYLTAYRNAKAALAGYTITSNFATVLAAVQTLITVDGEREGIAGTGNYTEKTVQQGIDDFHGGKALFDAFLLDAVREIQRKAPCYQDGHENTYLHDTVGVTVDGLASVVELPATREVAAVRWGRHYPDLEADTAYAVEDFVLSNGRAYEVVTAGTTPVSLGDGLTSTDGEDETLGTAVFRYYGPTGFRDAHAVAWSQKYHLVQGSAPVQGIYCTNPQGEKIWFFPALNEDREVRVEWNGLKQTFSGSDTVPFDTACEAAAAEYVRAMIQKNILEDTRASGVSFVVWQNHLKNLWLDCQSRQTGRN